MTARVIGAALLALASPAALGLAPQRGLQVAPGRDWVGKGAGAPYAWKDGELVGTVIPHKDNSFLVSTRTYRDFIFQFETRLDHPDLNSGVMVRGLSEPGYRNGVVHGYQVEVDGTSRAWTGGIYDEQRRLWLHTLADNPAAQAAFRPGDWNRIRIEAIGNRIRTWVNGVPAADLIDDMTAEGFVGFQVHGTTNPELFGKSVHWRNIRLTAATAADRRRSETAPAAIDPQVYLPNRLTAQEKARGWRLLWDGKSFAGWQGARGEPVDPATWSAGDGTFTVQSNGGQPQRARNAFSKDSYGDFDLQLDFRVTPGANSGIKYLYQLPPAPTEGLEYQIIDDALHPDAGRGRDGNRSVGSLYDLVGPVNLSAPGRVKPVNPPGEWNRARIRVCGGRIQHWLNGAKLVEIDRKSPDFAARVADSKFRDKPGFGTWPAGHIMLQDHGDTVSYRSIKLKPLTRRGDRCD
jgi:hypothetical protein